MKRRFPIAGLLVAAALGGCTNWGADRTDPYGRYFNLGRDAYQAGRWQAAADNLTHYLQAYPSSPRRAEAYYYRGLARVKLERRQAAREDFDRAVHSQPSARVRSLAHVAMGNLHYEEGQDARALEAYEQGLRSPAPEVPQERVALRLAISLQRLGRWADADRYLAMVIRRYPQTAAAEEARRRYHMDAFAVQTGAFARSLGAQREAEGLRQAGFRPRIRTTMHERQTLHTVRVGQAATYAEARRLAQRVNQAGFAAMIVP